jgi:hypothetical protein
MSGMSNRVRDYPEVENDEVAWTIYFPDYYGKGPAKLALSFNSPKAHRISPSEMMWKVPCEKLGEEGWHDAERSIEEVRTCGCSYCQICFDLILRWRVMR